MTAATHSHARARAIDPDVALRTLSESREPLLIGVRHHSPSLAAVMPEILATFAPTVLMVELPADFERWIPWLGHPLLEAPVALAGASTNGDLFFYPFADFSPELAAIRWAHAQCVPIVAIDRPVNAAALSEDESPRRPDRARDREREGGLLERLEDGDDVEGLWDRLVECHAATATPEAIRRAALLFGFLLRADTLIGGHISPSDAMRERHMRAHVQAAVGRGERVACVVGAFHANALVTVPVAEEAPKPPPKKEREVAKIEGSLVPYDYALFDSRSGYPAGIRDPALVQRLFELRREGRTLADEIATLLVDIARAMRSRGHVASFSDVREATRMALDLATLRGLAAPGRRELLEAVETTLGQGELLGRGRILAGALETVLVGARRGRLAEGTPESGLLRHVEALLRALNLPGPRDVLTQPKELTLDPLRSLLDRKRALAIERLDVCLVPYAERREGLVRRLRGELERLTLRVRVRFMPETAARLSLAGVFGVELEQAAEGTIRMGLRRAEAKDGASANDWLDALEAAARAGLGALVDELLDAQASALLVNASVAELTRALGLLARIELGAYPGLPREALEGIAAYRRSLAGIAAEVLGRAVLALEGIIGSTREDDVLALRELLGFVSETSSGLHSLLDRMAEEGSALIRGASEAARVLMGRRDAASFFVTFTSWFDFGGDDAAAARERSDRIRGGLLLAGPLFEGHPRFAVAILEEVDRLDDARFLARLASLRQGFDVLSAAGRQGLLDVLGQTGAMLELATEPLALALHASADAAAANALAASGLGPADVSEDSVAVAVSQEASFSPRTDHRIGLLDRVRLILGRERKSLGGSNARYAAALDELYGAGHGEGSREASETGQGTSFPTARDWGAAIEALFGERVRDEVLGRAAEQGYASAALALDPEQVVPSMELLEQVLSLRGSVGEGELATLRRIVRRVIDALVQELAVRLRPALTGLATPRPTRRPGPLDLRQTVQRNLKTARPREDGAPGFELVPTTFMFRTRARRSVDWRIVLVVDVSGSMEASVIYSAMIAAILSGLPALTTHFVAFADEPIDLSERVSDPLELLLGVKIGGGTNIGSALRAARQLLTNPSRSLVVLVSDFEEGHSVARMIAEVRALAETGATLLGVASLDDRGAPRYQRALAAQVVHAGMPVAALSPLELARWVGERVRGSS